jgi:hypothetical protein
VNSLALAAHGILSVCGVCTARAGLKMVWRLGGRSEKAKRGCGIDRSLLNVSSREALQLRGRSWTLRSLEILSDGIRHLAIITESEPLRCQGRVWTCDSPVSIPGRGEEYGCCRTTALLLRITARAKDTLGSRASALA